MLGDNRVECAIQFTARASWCAGGMCVSPAQLGRCPPTVWESKSPPFLINRDGRLIQDSKDREAAWLWMMASIRKCVRRDDGTERKVRRRGPAPAGRIAGGGGPCPVPSAAVAAVHPRTYAELRRAQKIQSRAVPTTTTTASSSEPGGRGPNHRACVAVRLRCINNSIPPRRDAPTCPWPP